MYLDYIVNWELSPAIFNVLVHLIICRMCFTLNEQLTKKAF